MRSRSKPRRVVGMQVAGGAAPPLASAEIWSPHRRVMTSTTYLVPRSARLGVELHLTREGAAATGFPTRRYESRH